MTQREIRAYLAAIGRTGGKAGRGASKVRRSSLYSSYAKHWKVYLQDDNSLLPSRSKLPLPVVAWKGLTDEELRGVLDQIRAAK